MGNELSEEDVAALTSSVVLYQNMEQISGELESPIET